MKTTVTDLTPGIYQYTYPTFTDVPQHICIHFLTPDCQQAFVSYPNGRKGKAAQFVPLKWFDSVELVPLEGQPQLLSWIVSLLAGCLDSPRQKPTALKLLSAVPTIYVSAQQLMA